MPRHRRANVHGGTYFFTVVTHGRRPIFADTRAVALLGVVLRKCRTTWPFKLDAIVVLPDHLHAIMSLPPGDANFPGRWSVI